MKKKSKSFFRIRSTYACAVLIAICFVVCDAAHHGVVGLAHSDLFRSQSVRVGFSNTLSFEKSILLLQEDGSVDTAKTFLFNLPDGVGPGDIMFTQTTSNRKVLNYQDNANLLISFSKGVANITSAFSFDEMVGKCDYTLTAVKKSTNEVLSTLTVKFIIVGVTFYVEELAGAVFIVSGVGRKYSISYTETVERKVLENRKIRVFIQYPDGTCSDDFEGRPIPRVEVLKISADGNNGLFEHESSRCEMKNIGTLAGDRHLELPDGCGYGFYYDSAGNLCFGIAYDPYRVGSVTFHSSWPGLTSNFAALSGESFEFSFTVSVTGTPPVGVLRRLPRHGYLRPEGGEVITLDIINAYLHNITDYHIEVWQVEHFFEMIPGTFHDSKAFPYAKTVSFVSGSGSGKDLNWTLVYQVDKFADDKFTQVYEDAKYLPKSGDFFTYDDMPLIIQSMTPSLGTVQGGALITIKGHFPFFDPERDGVYFSGTKLNSKKVKLISEGIIEFYSPSKSALGVSYEYHVAIRMGNGISNISLFYFLVKNAAVRVSQSGTSELGNNTYRVGSCTPARFTAVVVPYTNQIRSYTWSLHFEGDEGKDLLQTEKFKSINPSAQTLELSPDLMNLGGYTLKIVVSLLGTTLETDILLMRDDIISIGVFILKPPERSIAFPETPLRLSAVVRTPSCYSGSQAMIFEWTAFDQVQRFSSSNATDVPHEGLRTTTPARLGWEYVIPRESLTVGKHPVSLKVWMEEQENVFGQAESEVIILESPLFSIIRHGEEYLTTNHRSSLSVFGSKSHDPDIFGDEKYNGLTYEWTCLQASTSDFVAGTSEPCISALLPSRSSESFDVQMNLVESLTEIKFVLYSLVVRKRNNRASEEARMIIEIRSGGKLPHLNEYEVAMTNTDGEALNLTAIPYYEQSILEVIASPEVTWTYELLEPSEIDFFSSSNLINNPLFYSIEANLYSVTGNNRPLGIEAWKLRPFTKYRIKILFDATEEHETTEVIVSIRTTEALILGFPTPTIIEGTTATTFTATAGIPMTSSGFSYYFVLQDSEGYEFCLGGCTGYDVIHFKIGRPGTYVIAAYIFDMQGKALLDSSTLEQKIIVRQSELSVDYRNELDTLFANGNDPCWTQMAHELAIALLEYDETTVSVRLSETRIGGYARAMEDVKESQTEMVAYLSAGARKIVCTAYPNSYHGKDFMVFAEDLASLPSFRVETFYNVLQGLSCSIVNTPRGTRNMMQDTFARFLEKMTKHALNLHQGGSSRERLKNEEVSPFADEFADLLLWTTSVMFKSITSGKVVGFAATKQIGPDGKYGVISFVVASSAGHLPTRVEEGKVLSVIKTSSANEEFIPRDTCRQNLFPVAHRRKLYFVFHVMPNFIESGGFQDSPSGSNLANKWYFVKIFAKGSDGEFQEILPNEDDYCFCWKLPITKMQDELEGSIDYMPGLVAATNLKEFGRNVSGHGETFQYETTQTGKTRDYNAKDGWVEACRTNLGVLVTSTKVIKSVGNVVVDTSGRIFGMGSATVGVIVVGALLFVVVALACSWILAVRAMSNGEVPLAAVVPNELYVERDVYGRATIYDANAVNDEDS